MTVWGLATHMVAVWFGAGAGFLAAAILCARGQD
jgi:hypothetical protein